MYTLECYVITSIVNYYSILKYHFDVFSKRFIEPRYTIDISHTQKFTFNNKNSLVLHLSKNENDTKQEKYRKLDSQKVEFATTHIFWLTLLLEFREVSVPYNSK